MYDWLIVGAGFSGAVLAERLATQTNARVLVCDQRDHVGGNAYDRRDGAGVLIHQYGPHIFHTNSERIFAYLSQFTKWRAYEHKVLACVDGRLLPFPINLDTVNRLYGWSLSSGQLRAHLEAVAERVPECKTSEDAVVSKVGRALYEKFFKNYTRKQWGLDPSQLDAAVAARVPARLDRDDRYFLDRFQFMPKEGFTRLFENMLSHERIDLALGESYRAVRDRFPAKAVIFTGPIDEYFDFCFGKLPYRSIRFDFQSHDVETFQSGPVINYPNEHAYTRVTEFKYLTGQRHPKTTVVYEYPNDDGDPFYPVPRAENAALYRRYKALGDRTPGVHFCGRLGTYRYYNMDQVVGQALALFDELSGARDALPARAA
jgi:UDP-galactopyranose mutase